MMGEISVFDIWVYLCLLWWVWFGSAGWSLCLRQGICGVGQQLELRRLLQLSGFEVSAVFFCDALEAMFGFEWYFSLWKMWGFVLEHLDRCYIEYRLNSRFSI